MIKMLFDKNYNKTLRLMLETNAEFYKKYKEIFDELPSIIHSKCHECKDFKYKINNKTYELYQSSIFENTIEFSIDDKSNNTYIELCLTQIAKEEIEKLNIWNIEDYLDDNDAISIGSLSITNDDQEITFDFSIERLDQKEFSITVDKTISKENPIKLNDLLTKINISANKR